MIQTTLSLATIVLFISTLIPYIRVHSAWVRAFDFPRSQIAVLSGLMIILWLSTSDGDSRSFLFIALLFSCMSYQVYQIWPYTQLHKYQVQWSKDPEPPYCLSLLMANVQMENRNVDQLTDFIAQQDPDIILAVETDHWWTQHLRQLTQRYPYTVLQPQENHYGMVLFSRLPLVESEVKFLVEDDIPSIHAKIRLRSGDMINLHGLHPRPPLPYPQIDSTGRDAELVVVGRAVKATNAPAIVAGDLNDVAWSHTTRLFQRLSGLLDPRIGRGMYNTFHTSYPFLRWPLDHVFHSEHFQLITLKRGPAFGSDHFPVYIKLNYEPENRAEQSKPQAKIEDHIEASETLENAEAMTGRSIESPQQTPPFALPVGSQ